MNVVVWLKSKWRVIVGGVVVALAWLLFTLGIMSAEEAFGMAMSGAVLGGFSQSLASHKAQVIDALDAQKQWHEQRAQAVAEAVQGVALPLMGSAEPMIPVSAVKAVVAQTLDAQTMAAIRNV